MHIALLITSGAFLTSILSGVFGMAGGLVFMGLLAWLLPAAVALALHGLIQFASNLWRAALHRVHVVWSVLMPFGAGATGAIGVFSLLVFAPIKLYVFLGLGLLPLLVWLPERWVRLDAANWWHSLTGGFVSTGLSLISGVSGPVTDLLFINSRLNRHQIVATKALMQAIGHASKVVVYGSLLLGACARETVPVMASAAAVLASMAGIVVGGYILDRISEAHFKAGRRWILTLIGLGFLYQASVLAFG